MKKAGVTTRVRRHPACPGTRVSVVRGKIHEFFNLAAPEQRPDPFVFSASHPRGSDGSTNSCRTGASHSRNTSTARSLLVRGGVQREPQARQLPAVVAVSPRARQASSGAPPRRPSPRSASRTRPSVQLESRIRARSRAARSPPSGERRAGSEVLNADVVCGRCLRAPARDQVQFRHSLALFDRRDEVRSRD